MISVNYFEPWKNYQNLNIRQLAFALASPNLIHYFPSEIMAASNINFHDSAEWQKFYYAYEPKLSQLDQNPEELNQFLGKIKSTRLGLRFEALLWFWLQDPKNQYFQLLGHSIQSHHKGKTLGEIDFLIKNLETNKIEHWEVCLKYYLAEPDLALNTWIGLNPDDTLAQKLHHLAHRQFQFETALGYLIDEKKVVIKGQFYLPQQHTHLPNWINTDRRLGEWYATLPNHADLRRLKRSEWICPEGTCTPQSSPIKWWNNGLYYNAKDECFTMLRLPQISYILRK